MRTLCSFILILLLTEIASAQTTIENGSLQNSVNEVVISEKASTPLKHIFSVDFIPLFGFIQDSPGLGLGYQFIINSHYAIGTNLYYKKHHSANNPYLNEVNIRYVNAGIEARYKFNSFYEDGFYGGIGLTSSGVQGDIKMKNIFGDSLGSAETIYQWATLIVPRLGYSWVPKSKGSYGDFSISYDSVDEVKYSYRSEVKNSQSANMEIEDRKIGLNFTYTIGFVF